MKFRKIIKVFGKVQGVGFRYATQRQAIKIGEIYGEVKNHDDGSVEILIEGDETKVDDLIAWCYKGSTMSDVDRVEIMESSPIDEIQVGKDFKIIKS